MIIQPTLQDVLTIGGRVITDLANLIQLETQVSNANPTGTARKMAGSAGYQVPASKQFRIIAVRLNVAANAASAASPGRLVYSDNDVGLAAGVAFTNPVYWGSSSALANLGSLSTVATLAVQEFAIMDFIVPATKYPGFSGAGGGHYVGLFGYEEAV
jgi:hypothetical protein